MKLVQRELRFLLAVWQANLLAADTALSGVVLNVARGEAITLWEIVAALEEALGRPLARQTVSARPGDGHRDPRAGLRGGAGHARLSAADRLAGGIGADAGVAIRPAGTW